jgi:hypothetical protein
MQNRTAAWRRVSFPAATEALLAISLQVTEAASYLQAVYNGLTDQELKLVGSRWILERKRREMSGFAQGSWDAFERELTKVLGCLVFVLVMRMRKSSWTLGRI